MPLRLFNSDRPFKDNYSRPDEILNDEFLTPVQKYLVLEAMLVEEIDGARPDKRAEAIQKAKARLRGMLR